MPAYLFDNVIKAYLQSWHRLSLAQDSIRKGLIPENPTVCFGSSVVLLLTSPSLSLRYESSVAPPGCRQSPRKLGQNPVCRKPGDSFKTQIPTMSAPGIILRLLHDPSPHRIQMDITGEFQQISILINEDRLVTPLKKMTCPALTPIDPAGIAKTEILQDSRERESPHLNRQVDMVAQQTEGMDAVTKSLDPFLDQKAEASAVSIIGENGLTAVAAQGDVIQRPRIMNSWLPSHRPILQNKLPFCKPDPRGFSRYGSRYSCFSTSRMSTVGVSLPLRKSQTEDFRDWPSPANQKPPATDRRLLVLTFICPPII